MPLYDADFKGGGNNNQNTCVTSIILRRVLPDLDLGA